MRVRKIQDCWRKHIMFSSRKCYYKHTIIPPPPHSFSFLIDLQKNIEKYDVDWQTLGLVE